MIIASIASHGGQQITVFFVQIVLLITVGRLLGEWMQRVGQPAVLGQLLAGIMLGPSLFGAIWPAAQQAIFPTASADRQMLNAVSELGVLMLLLLTGMETDLALVKRVRRTAAITSAAGILIPFACGFLLGQFVPDSVLPDPGQRFLTSLFLATALSISSVKIVAAVLSEVGFLRRDLGQVILAAAIIDDTIGWTILALISGLATQGKVVLGPLLFSIIGTGAFLIFCFTLGTRLVAKVIRWSNDFFVSEMSVISVILVLMITLALVTNFIGVHTVLGAFVAGVMIGQSPILTKHIEQELRGLIIALFMPVFFGVAGLSIDLKVLTEPRLLELALLFIVLASIGKLVGCYIGSRLARLNHPEALAVGFGMNARGSTEVILATIGLTMGLLNQQLFTIIVLMAVVTTLCMPPLLRWALARVPIRPDEKVRMETEAAEENDLMPKLERILVGVDASETGQLASLFAGYLIGARRLTATVMDMGIPTLGSRPSGSKTVIKAAEAATNQARAAMKGKRAELLAAAAEQANADGIPIRELVSVLPFAQPVGSGADFAAKAVLAEARNGYGLLFLGLDSGAEDDIRSIPPVIEKIFREFSGPVAVLVHGSTKNAPESLQLNKILVPTTGADYSRFGAEVAVAIAKGCGATLTALHISAPVADNELLRYSKQLLRAGHTLLGDLVNLGKREGISVVSKNLIGPTKENAILRQATHGGAQLIVLGIKAWTGDQLHLGHSAEALIQNAPSHIPILIVRS